MATSSQEAEQAKVMQQVEASAVLIDEMIQEVARELFLDAAVAHVMEGQDEGGQAQAATGGAAAAVAAAVGRRLELMDGTFLATLDGYIQGASDKGAAEVAELLLMVRDEVLRRLSAQLPPEMRLMEAALAAPDAQQRLALLQQYALLSTDAMPQEAEIVGSSEEDGDAVGGSLYCLAADLEASMSRVISDMELLPKIPDRRLLARLVLLKEEVHQLLAEASYLQGGPAAGSREADALRLPFRQAEVVPKADTAFLQRLMGLSAPDERRALLEWAFEDDRERLRDTQGIGAQRGTPLTTREQARKAAEAPQEWVRPGRFMQCVAALQQEMLERAEGSAGSGNNSGGEDVPSDAVLERLESVRREALQVLLALADEGLPFRP